MDRDERYRDSRCESRLIQRRGDVQQRQADQGWVLPFTIRDSSNGNSSVQDIAENHLDGVFYGKFPSGNGINGSDFVAELDAYHAKVFAPQTIVGTASAANGGVGGKPVGAVHSGVFSPVVPRDGSPVFKATPAAARRRIAALTSRRDQDPRRQHEAASRAAATRTDRSTVRNKAQVRRTPQDLRNPAPTIPSGPPPDAIFPAN